MGRHKGGRRRVDSEGEGQSRPGSQEDAELWGCGLLSKP